MTIGNKLPLAHISSRRYVYSTPEIQVEYSANMKQADGECIRDTLKTPQITCQRIWIVPGPVLER